VPLPPNDVSILPLALSLAHGEARSQLPHRHDLPIRLCRNLTDREAHVFGYQLPAGAERDVEVSRTEHAAGLQDLEAGGRRIRGQTTHGRFLSGYKWATGTHRVRPPTGDGTKGRPTNVEQRPVQVEE
jgi:hypothetical protein